MTKILDTKIYFPDYIRLKKSFDYFTNTPWFSLKVHWINLLNNAPSTALSPFTFYLLNCFVTQTFLTVDWNLKITEIRCLYLVACRPTYSCHLWRRLIRESSLPFKLLTLTSSFFPSFTWLWKNGNTFLLKTRHSTP